MILSWAFWAWPWLALLVLLVGVLWAVASARKPERVGDFDAAMLAAEAEVRWIGRAEDDLVERSFLALEREVAGRAACPHWESAWMQDFAAGVARETCLSCGVQNRSLPILDWEARPDLAAAGPLPARSVGMAAVARLLSAQGVGLLSAQGVGLPLVRARGSVEWRRWRDWSGAGIGPPR